MAILPQSSFLYDSSSLVLLYVHRDYIIKDYYGRGSPRWAVLA